jgi:hypothetical protein
MRFFDCNALVGVRGDRHVETPFTVERLLEDMAYYDIHGALLCVAAAKEYYPTRGNELAVKAASASPRLAACWVLLPHHAGEMAPPRELLRQMERAGVRAARLCPKTHGYGTHALVIGELLSALAEAKLPVFLDRAEVELAQVDELCRNHPGLPLVLCGVSWGEDRALLPLLKAHGNLHLETSAFQGHRAYERVAREVGAERLLFGTEWPFRSPGAARMMAVYERLEPEERELIAHGNLERLLSAAFGGGADGAFGGGDHRALPEHEPRAESDPILDAVREGRPLTEEFVFDAHAHLAHDGCMGVGICALPYNDAAGLVGSMDRLGIDRALVSSWGGIALGDRDGNDVTLRAVERFPERLVAFGTLNPHYPELFEAEFERVFASDRVRGFKPYPPCQHYALDGERNRPLLAWANERAAPVLCHAGLGGHCVTPEQLDKLGPEYPRASFLFAHVGQSYAVAEKCVDVCRRHPNVYCEITYTAITYGLIEYLVREIGAERVLFGTDCVMRDPAPQLGWVAWARISLEDKRKILGGNMRRLLGEA